VAGGGYTDYPIAVEAGTLKLIGLAEGQTAQLLVVEILDPTGLLVGVSQSAPGRALATVSGPLPGMYTVRVRNIGAVPVDYTRRISRSVPWL
jgi:hypothetical protein